MFPETHSLAGGPALRVPADLRPGLTEVAEFIAQDAPERMRQEAKDSAQIGNAIFAATVESALNFLAKVANEFPTSTAFAAGFCCIMDRCANRLEVDPAFANSSPWLALRAEMIHQGVRSAEAAAGSAPNAARAQFQADVGKLAVRLLSPFDLSRHQTDRMVLVLQEVAGQAFDERLCRC